MRDKIRTFMIGRYGNDGLNRFLCGVALALMLLASLLRSRLLELLALGLLGWAWYRMLSRSAGKRSQENAVYYALKQQVVSGWSLKRREWAQRGAYRFYRCPKCGQKLRVPKGRGRISISCPKCHTEFIKKS